MRIRIRMAGNMIQMPPRKKVRSMSITYDENANENSNLECPSVKKEEGKEMDWRCNLKGIRAVNGYALKEGILADVTFEVGAEAKPFKAHKLILALASPVFEAMFYGGLAEKGEKVVIPDIAPEGFDFLLRYIYTEEVSFKNASEAFMTCTAAEKYCMPRLKEQSEYFISCCELTAENVWIFLENSLFLDMKVVTERCLEFLKRNTTQALKDSSFLDTTAEAIERVLSSDSLEASELMLLKSIIRWAEKRPSSSKETSIKEHLDPLMRHIRFGILNPASFCTFLEEEKNIFSDSDALAILKHLTNPQTCSLPEWCCSKIWRSTVSDRVMSPSRKVKSSIRRPLPSQASPKYDSYHRTSSCASRTRSRSRGKHRRLAYTSSSSDSSSSSSQYSSLTSSSDSDCS
ncbi:BTB/POZ domain-containing protein 3-like [Stegodyphus dumicola]|uniref:BTB/POZ domain-containing protein 3-like n=1 Tax=Stegodyphus dumicola TaxID=202533 RepID=UPI0015B07863|nr:BTB/POZ domain-containing protein 3-like [Stegodyphus dumicola]